MISMDREICLLTELQSCGVFTSTITYSPVNKCDLQSTDTLCSMYATLTSSERHGC